MDRPIDLQNGPLIRITLLRRAENDYAAVASTHHIIHDGWSMGVLLRELAVLYPAFAAGRPSPLPELPIQYVDFAAWQRQLLQGETLERLRSYWREQLQRRAGPGTAYGPSAAGHPHHPRIAPGPAGFRRKPAPRCAEFCRREGATPFMTLLAAF